MGIKVLHLIDSGGLYGAEKMLLSLVKHQMEQGLEPMILSAGAPNVGEKPLEREASQMGLPLIAWRMKPGLNIAESGEILQWARANGYDILHSHGFKFNVLLGARPLIVRRIPMIATLHGYVHAKRFSKMWLYELLDRLAINCLQFVVLVGEAMRKELPPRLRKSKKVKVIANGLDSETIEHHSTMRVDLEIRGFVARHSPIVLGVGRLSEEKGFDRLIDAFPAVCNEFENAGLILVGEGKQREALEMRKGKLGLGHRVLMPGYSNNVPAIQNIADLIVVPSRTEGLPITLLEAMALGLPVLASPVGEIPFVLGNGEGGYLLPEDCDYSELGSCIVNSLRDSQQKSKVNWSLRRVSNHYSVKAMEKSYRELYQSALGDQA
ncbi:glycosyltransferase [Marinobacter pelagius]|uniref:Glycosyltransferase involved in cell wall bisynthesis n=1 Tax=Marinobacter pelagius TaxID=379482 RepID=A0A1I4T0B7_9GAMM|nr:glycosyltransferase [Marinobacter pelagius]SFM70182.1 Glycosyltransferase involved in cell wall bisynthesis [Marinobacter pelagius]